jgi:large subunit ribosomal protein L21
MYAVVKTGGKQYRIAAGETIHVEKLDGDAGQPVELDEVLLLADGEDVVLGRPFIEGAKVRAEIVDQGKDRKVIIFKYRRRKRYRRKTGHRQPHTILRIHEIQWPGRAAAEVA